MPLQHDTRTRVASLAAALCLFVCALTQAQQQTPRPEREDEVVRITTELVQTDVSVFDKRGHFVEDLKPEQFELQVDGRVQPVIFFERVTAGSLNEESQLTAAARRGREASKTAESNTSNTNVAEAPARGRLIFFFLDDLHMSGASLAHARESLQRYVESGLGANDQAAIVTASGQVGFLQQLTDNRAVLRAAIKRLGYRQNPENYPGKTRISEYEASQVLDSGNRELYAYLLESTKIEQQMGPGSRHGDHRLAASYSAAPNLRNRLRQARATGEFITEATLDALRSLMLSAAELPGRKLVFFLSDGFILNERNGGALETLRGVAQEAARAGAVVYTMDMRENTSSGITSSVDATTNDYIDLTARRVGIALGEMSATREPLQLIADQTGGRAIYNSDSVEEVVRQAVRETADYYLLAWRPDAAEQRKTSARLKVSVKGHPEWRVRLRAASFNAASAATKRPEQPARESQAEVVKGAVESKQANVQVKSSKAVEAKSAEAKANDIELLTALGSLFPRKELPVALSVGYLDAGAEGTLLNISMQLGRTDFGFDTWNTSDASGDKAKALVDVAGAAIDDRGQFGSFKQLLTLTPDPTDPEASRPVIWHQRLRLKPGLYQVRVALRDRATGRVGGATQWVEIPDLSKGDFALSSVFLGERGAESAGSEASAGKTRSVVVDVDHRFARASVLRFQTYVYNAARGTGDSDVQIHAQVLRGEKPLVTTQPLKVPVTSDPARLPFWSELSLAELPPGRYVLQVTATDRTANRTAVERVAFSVE